MQYSTIARRALFPPIVPNNIPSFDGRKGKQFAFFFKKSIANYAGVVNNQSSEDIFKHVQITIRYLSNNKSSISKSKYKLGYIIVPLSNVALDQLLEDPKPNFVYRVSSKDPKSPYCIILNTLGDSFEVLNSIYKIQIRLGSETYNPKWTTQDIIRMERGTSQQAPTVSDWSSVTLMKPIEPPQFGLYKFFALGELDSDDPRLNNLVSTANFEYTGYYDNTVLSESSSGGITVETSLERLSEYWFELYDSQKKVLLSSSEKISTIEHDRPKIAHTFTYLTQDETTYFIKFGIKTENGYEEVKTYQVTGKYKVLEMSNASVRVKEERENARFKLSIQAKQVVLEPIVNPETGKDSKIGFVLDKNDPQYYDAPPSEKEDILSTHMVIEGSTQASKSFYLSCPNDVWTLEGRVTGLIPYETRQEALRRPYFIVENNHDLERNIPYYCSVYLICYKDNTTYTQNIDVSAGMQTDSKGIKRYKRITAPTPPTRYFLEAVKVVKKKVGGNVLEITTQTAKYQSTENSDLSFKYDVPKNYSGITYPIYQKKPDGSVGLTTTINWEEKRGKRTTSFVEPIDFLPIHKFDPSNPSVEKIANMRTKRKLNFKPNKPKPFNKMQEAYIFLSNWEGGLQLQVWDEEYIVKPITGDKKNQAFINYLNTKKVSDELIIDKPKEKDEKER